MALIMPQSSRPSNLHLRPDQVRYELDGEALLWLENLPLEVMDGDRLFVVIHEDHPKPYVIMEHADDGSDMYVARVSALDGRAYEMLRRARQLDLSERVRQFEKEEVKAKEVARQEELDELYENIGGPMYRQMHRDGFAHGRSESFPKAGPKVERARAEKRVILP